MSESIQYTMSKSEQQRDIQNLKKDVSYLKSLIADNHLTANEQTIVTKSLKELKSKKVLTESQLRDELGL